MNQDQGSKAPKVGASQFGQEISRELQQSERDGNDLFQSGQDAAARQQRDNAVGREYMRPGRNDGDQGGL